MAGYETLIAKLNEKRAKFLEFETVSEAMLGCPVEDIERYINERAQLIEIIDAIDAQMTEIILGDPQAVLLVKAVSGGASRGELNDDVGDVYDRAAGVRAVISRLPDLELQVSMRLRVEQQHILELIKKSNASTEAKVSKFYNTEQGRQGNVIRDA